MLKKRIIPILLINEDQMVKSTKYKNYSYVGDPINIIKIFNEKEADEIIVLDVKRSISNEEPFETILEQEFMSENMFEELIRHTGHLIDSLLGEIEINYSEKD